MKEEKMLYSVKDICNKYGITRKTLFYYDRTGLLKPAERKGRQRFKYYDDDSLGRLDRIRDFREAGLNIAEIKEVINLSDSSLIHDVLKNAKVRLETEAKEKKEEIRRLNILIKSFLED